MIRRWKLNAHPCYCLSGNINPLLCTTLVAIFFLAYVSRTGSACSSPCQSYLLRRQIRLVQIIEMLLLRWSLHVPHSAIILFCWEKELQMSYSFMFAVSFWRTCFAASRYIHRFLQCHDRHKLHFNFHLSLMDETLTCRPVSLRTFANYVKITGMLFH